MRGEGGGTANCVCRELWVVLDLSTSQFIAILERPFRPTKLNGQDKCEMTRITNSEAIPDGRNGKLTSEAG